MSDKAFAALIELRSSVIALESHPYSPVDHLTERVDESNPISSAACKLKKCFKRIIKDTIIKLKSLQFFYIEIFDMFQNK